LLFHTGKYDEIFQRLDTLKFDTSLLESIDAGEVVLPENHAQERKLLWQVLGINLFFFVLESISGIVAKSMGLVADSLDMLADSFVYGLALFAVGGTLAMKKNIAKTAGILQLILAILGIAEVIRRFIGFEPVPSFQAMIIISVLALTGNWLSLYLLQKSKSKDTHMQASMIFTNNDIIVNIGVIIAGGLVYLTSSKYPDLIVGSIIFIIVVKGAIKIFKLT
jgi:Co/Zn/Cd efflux system component